MILSVSVSDPLLSLRIVPFGLVLVCSLVNPLCVSCQMLPVRPSLGLKDTQSRTSLELLRNDRLTGVGLLEEQTVCWCVLIQGWAII